MQLLAPIARQVLTEMNATLLLDTGQLTESGLRRTPDGGLKRILGVELARTAGSRHRANRAPSLFRRRLPPPSSSRHDSPRLAAERVHEEDAAAQLSILRAIASSDLHNLVYLSDYRIVPVVTANPSAALDHGAKAT